MGRFRTAKQICRRNIFLSVAIAVCASAGVGAYFICESQNNFDGNLSIEAAESVTLTMGEETTFLYSISYDGAICMFQESNPSIFTYKIEDASAHSLCLTPLSTGEATLTISISYAKASAEAVIDVYVVDAAQESPPEEEPDDEETEDPDEQESDEQESDGNSEGENEESGSQDQTAEPGGDESGEEDNSESEGGVDDDEVAPTESDSGDPDGETDEGETGSDDEDEQNSDDGSEENSESGDSEEDTSGGSTESGSENEPQTGDDSDDNSDPEQSETSDDDSGDSSGGETSDSDTDPKKVTPTEFDNLISPYSEDEDGTVFSVLVQGSVCQGEIEISSSSVSVNVMTCTTLSAYIIDDTDGSIVTTIQATSFVVSGTKIVKVSSEYVGKKLLLIGENTSGESAYRTFWLV